MDNETKLQPRGFRILRPRHRAGPRSSALMYVLASGRSPWSVGEKLLTASSADIIAWHQKLVQRGSRRDA